MHIVQATATHHTLYTRAISTDEGPVDVGADDNYVARLAGRQNRLIQFLSVFIRR
jgi:hypothetical protein